MKITGVKTTPYAVTPRLIGARPAGCIVELHTDGGLTGIAAGRHDAGEAIAQLAGTVLKGQDPRGTSGLWQRMRDACRRDLHDLHAAALLDIALWDLKSKINAEPLWKTLGGSRPGAPAYASCIDAPRTDTELSKWCARMARDYGMSAVKLQVGRDQRADLRRLAAAHKALSRKNVPATLMVDADGRWSPKQAIRSLREMETRFDLTWVESPAPAWDFLGLKRISDSIRAAVCAGRNLGAPEDFLPHFHHRSIDIVQIDIGQHGITGALQIADAAFGLELPVTLCAAPGNVHAQLAGAMPYVMNVEINELTAGPFSGDMRVEDGRVVIGDAPGNGLAVERAGPAPTANGDRRLKTIKRIAESRRRRPAGRTRK